MKWSGRRCLAFVELYRSQCAELPGVGGERTMVATRVAELPTNFGGGKTHSLIALYHLASGAPVAELAGVEAMLVGQMISPGMVHTKDDGTEVRTLWRELAWQLGRAEAYATVTKANDVRAALTATGVRSVVLERLGLRRGDRMGLGGPIRLTTADGSIGLGGLRGPITLRLDQPDLAIATDESIVVVIENLQPAEIVCARYRDLPVVYTAGQFGGDAARLIEQLVSGNRRVIAIVMPTSALSALQAVCSMPPRARRSSTSGCGLTRHGGLPGQAARPSPACARPPSVPTSQGSVDRFATAVLARGYPVEQELATPRHRPATTRFLSPVSAAALDAPVDHG